MTAWFHSSTLKPPNGGFVFLDFDGEMLRHQTDPGTVNPGQDHATRNNQSYGRMLNRLVQKCRCILPALRSD